MKLLLFLFISVSGVLAQVDSVHTTEKIITGDMISATETEICISNYPFGRQWIPIGDVERFVMRSGKIIIGEDVPEQVYVSFVDAYYESLKGRTGHAGINKSSKQAYSKNWISGSSPRKRNR